MPLPEEDQHVVSRIRVLGTAKAEPGAIETSPRPAGKVEVTEEITDMKTITATCIAASMTIGAALLSSTAMAIGSSSEAAK